MKLNIMNGAIMELNIMNVQVNSFDDFIKLSLWEKLKVSFAGPFIVLLAIGLIRTAVGFWSGGFFANFISITTIIFSIILLIDGVLAGTLLVYVLFKKNASA